MKKKVHPQENKKHRRRTKVEDSDELHDDKAFEKEYIKRTKKLKYYLLAFVVVTILAAAVIPVFGLYDEVNPDDDF